MDNGTRLRLSGEGEPSPAGGPPGDCYCIIRVKEHPLFHRDGRDLICQVPISYSQATLGARISVPTLNGAEHVDVPAGTQPGEVFTLRGRGMPDVRYRGRGDLHVQVTVEVPKRLSERHEKLLRELAEIENSEVSPKRKTFFEKIKDLFHAEENCMSDETNPNPMQRRTGDGQSTPERNAGRREAAATNGLLEQLRTDLEAARDRVLRSQAELENYRKRAAREIEENRRYAELPLIRDLLPVLDNIERAIAAAEKSQDVAVLLDGIKLVARQFEEVLARHHCQRIGALHLPFDPHLHHAISQQPSERVSAEHGGAGGAARLPTARSRRAAQPGDRLPLAGRGGTSTADRHEPIVCKRTRKR